MIEATAYHEAGHMVAAWRMRMKIYKITIVPAEDYEGSIHHESPLRGIKLDIDGSDKAEIKATMVLICLAGPAAQRHYNPESLDDSVRRWHGASDFDIALDLAIRLASDDKVADAYLKWMQLRAEALITSNWKFVVAFANRLLERKTLEYREIGALISNVIALARRA